MLELGLAARLTPRLLYSALEPNFDTFRRYEGNLHSHFAFNFNLRPSNVGTGDGTRRDYGGGVRGRGHIEWTPERLRMAARCRQNISRSLAALHVLLAANCVSGLGVKRHWLAAVAWGIGSMAWFWLSTEEVQDVEMIKFQRYLGACWHISRTVQLTEMCVKVWILKHALGVEGHAEARVIKNQWAANGLAEILLPESEAEPTAERAAERPAERTVEHTVDRTAERTANRTVERTAERAVERVSTASSTAAADGAASESVQKTCDGCGAHGAGLKKCARYRSVRYCSKECQDRHWAAHKAHCLRRGPSRRGTTQTAAEAD